jgi:hypothetical protein
MSTSGMKTEPIDKKLDNLASKDWRIWSNGNPR